MKKSLGHCVPIGFSEIIYHFLLNKLVHSYVNDLACTHKDKSSSVKGMVFQDWKKKKKKTAIFFLVSFWLSQLFQFKCSGTDSTPRIFLQKKVSFLL